MHLKKNSQEFLHFRSSNRGNALVDGGANTVGISRDFVKKAGLKLNDDKQGFAKDFQGKRCLTYGKARATLQFGRVFYTADFTVIDTPPNVDVILGTPFHKQYGLDDIIRAHLHKITGERTVLAGEPRPKN